MPEFGNAIGGSGEIGIELAQFGSRCDARSGKAMLILRGGRGAGARGILCLLGGIARGFSLLNIHRRRCSRTEQQQTDQRNLPRGLLHAAGRNNT